MAIHIPHFKEKLGLLYKSGRNPKVTNAATLATEIGVVAPQIANWINGNAGMQESAIPESKLLMFCQLFALNIEDVLTDNMEHFNTLITRPYSGWKRLFDRAVPFDETNRIGISLKHRGLSYRPDENDLKGERFQLNDPFRLEIFGPPDWHVIVLVRDPGGVACWCPSQFFPDHQMPGNSTLSIPNNDNPPFIISEPTGQHWLLIVFTEKTLPSPVYQQLFDDLPLNRELAINTLEQTLNNKNVGQWLALRKAFYVVD